MARSSTSPRPAAGPASRAGSRSSIHVIDGRIFISRHAPRPGRGPGSTTSAADPHLTIHLKAPVTRRRAGDRPDRRPTRPSAEASSSGSRPTPGRPWTSRTMVAMSPLIEVTPVCEGRSRRLDWRSVRDPSERPEPNRPADSRRRAPDGRSSPSRPTPTTSARASASRPSSTAPSGERRSKPRHLRPRACAGRAARCPSTPAPTGMPRCGSRTPGSRATVGRPRVIVVDLHPSERGLEDRFAARVGSVLRDHARETDRIARVGPTRFHVLLPETSEPEAAVLAERVRATCRERGARSAPACP